MTNQLQLIILLFFLVTRSFGQNNVSYPTMSEKEALCYFLKIYSRDPDENHYTRKVDNNSRKYNPQYHNSWTKDFLERTNNYNYKLARNDEFKYADMLNKASLELKAVVEKLNFSKLYSII